MGLLFESIISDIILVLLAAASTCAVYIYMQYGHWQRKGLEYIAPIFPFGNFKDTVLQRVSFAQLTVQMYNSTTKPVLGIYTAFRPALFVRDPDIIRTILIKDFNNFQDRGVYVDEKRDPLSGHLFALSGEKWRRLRGKLSPTFTSGKLKAMFSTLVECGGPLDRFVGKAAEQQQQSVEMREMLSQFTTNVIASVGFGIDIDCIENPNTEFRRFGRKVFEPNFKNGLRVAITFLCPKLMPWTGMNSVDKDVEEFIVDVVQQNMERREQTNVSRKDFFQLLVQLRNTGNIQEDGKWETNITSDASKKVMSMAECSAQAFVFFVAGFETTSTTMSFALYELARDADIQRKVQKEIDTVLEQHGGELTYESVSAMKYLDCVIDETLRKYPPVSILVRECRTPWKIPNTNIYLDRETPVFIPVHALHHDPKYFPDPDKFDPERFSPENSEGKTFLDRPYLPFGDGPRNCIGMRLAKMQTKVGLVIMMLKYEYELAGSTRLPLVMNPAAFMLTPEGGINLTIRHRNK